MKIFNFIKQHKLTGIFMVIAAAAIFLVVIGRINNQAQTQTAAQLPEVSLMRAGDHLRKKTADIDNGIVFSLGQADLKSQMTAPIARIDVKLGDNVAAGQILVQLQNNDINAQLQQAVAGLAAAQARLDEMERGARPEDLQISQTGARESLSSLVNSINDAYAKSDDAIHNHIDKFFSDPRESSAKFTVKISISGAGQSTFEGTNNDLAAKVGKQKYEIEKMMAQWQSAQGAIDSSSKTEAVENALALAKKNLQTEIDFLNAMAPLVNSLSADNATYKQIIDGYKTEFSAARSTVAGSLASLQGTETAWRSAQKALDYKMAGSSAEQLQQGQAAVAQAQAAVDGLKAALAKTSIVSPIDGKISYISGHIGELANSGQLIASVVNPEALKIKAYASENDLQSIHAGDKAIFDGDGEGAVQSVSPAIDPQTKKAEVNVIVTKNSFKGIVIGQSVSLKISGGDTADSGVYLLPIQAVQFAGDGNSVFTVDGNSEISPISVTVGEVVGENVQITKGLTPDTMILPSVRGFEKGEKVIVK